MTKHIIFQVHFMKNGNIFKSRKVGERLPTLSTSYCLDSCIVYSQCSCLMLPLYFLSHRIYVTVSFKRYQNVLFIVFWSFIGQRYHILSSTLLYCISVKEPDGLTLSKGHCEQSFKEM